MALTLMWFFKTQYIKQKHICMKSFKYKLLLALTGLVLLAGCSKKFEENATNNNKPLNVPAGVILKAILGDVVVYPGDYPDKAGQYIASNYTYYGDNKYWNGSASWNFGTLNNVMAMETAAKTAAGSDVNPYHALGFFLRAYFFVGMSEKVGDMPLSEAFKGLSNPSPKYDTQKDIFKQSLLWLDSANAILNQVLPLSKLNDSYYEFSGDFYYKESIKNPSTTTGALIYWQKVVNSYKLRVLIELSKHSEDADLNVKSQFNDIVRNPEKYPIFTGNSDNLQYQYNDKFNYYPDNASNYGNNAGRLNIGATWLNTLSSLHDLRAMVVAEPARGFGFSDTSYQSFAGAPLGKDLGYLATESGAGRLSLYNYNHYYSGFTAEPTFIISYAEVCFSIAEAINRGWVNADAATYYNNGIKAMFEFYGITDGNNKVTFHNIGGTGNVTYIVPFSFTAYLNQSAVLLSGTSTTALNQILTQKYLAYARNSGLQGYYQWRRTGVPTFSTGDGTGNGGEIPKRFQYPNNEQSVNTINVNAAIQSQYGGAGDDINQLMWLIK
jgi:hypothetical protein